MASTIERVTALTDQLEAIAGETDGRIDILTQAEAASAQRAADERLARVLAEQRAAAADQLVAQLRAELAQMNAGQRPQVLVPGYDREVFYDPFTSIDPARWTAKNEAGGGTREEFNRPGNITTVPEGAQIEARRESYGGRSITSGYLTSEGKVAFGFGHLFEVEATMPPLDKDAAGLWPCPLWLRASPKSGELDACEAYGQPFKAGLSASAIAQMTNSFACTTHNDTVGGPARLVTAPPGGTIAPGSRHRYGVAVTDEGICYYLDGKPVPDIYSRPNPVTWAQLAALKDKNGTPTPVLKSSFDAPLHMRIQLQVGSPTWGPSTPATKFPARMLIHWARVTRKP